MVWEWGVEARAGAGKAKQEITQTTGNPSRTSTPYLLPHISFSTPQMRPNTPTSQSAVGPAVSRLPPNVLSLMFSFNCKLPKVSPALGSAGPRRRTVRRCCWLIRLGLQEAPVLESELVQIRWGRYSNHELSRFSRVCRAWTEPAQAGMVKSVGLGTITKCQAAATSRLLDKYEVQVLTVAARGKKVSRLYARPGH